MIYISKIRAECEKSPEFLDTLGDELFTEGRSFDNGMVYASAYVLKKAGSVMKRSLSYDEIKDGSYNSVFLFKKLFVNKKIVLAMSYDENVQNRIKPFIDESFPFKAANPYLNPMRLMHIKATFLTGEKETLEERYDYPGIEPNRLKLFGTWCEEFSCFARKDVFWENFEMHVTRGYIRAPNFEVSGSFSGKLNLFFNSHGFSRLLYYPNF